MRFFVSITACLIYSLDMILSPFPSFKFVEYEIILEMSWGFLFVFTLYYLHWAKAVHLSWVCYSPISPNILAFW